MRAIIIVPHMQEVELSRIEAPMCIKIGISYIGR
jgi:hypothetical protein